MRRGGGVGCFLIFRVLLMLKLKLARLLSYDLRHAAVNQIWRLFSGPFLLLFIPVFLSPESQGYWYTFISLAALAIFADMGFSAILTLFSSYEFSRLRFNSDKTLDGDVLALERISSLWVFAIKWSILMVVVVFPIILIGGFFFLNGKSQVVSWRLAWVIYGVASVLLFLNAVVLSFIEGCDSVGDVQKIKFRVNVVGVFFSLFLLWRGFGLYSLSISLLCASLVGSLIIWRDYRKLFLQLFDVARNSSIRWFEEVAPLMWRYSVSWISGYFIFSIFSPIAFKYYTVVDAGRVGLSIAVFTAIFTLANIWMSVVVPKLNMLVAVGDRRQLNAVFYKYLSLSLGTYIFGVALLFCFFVISDQFFPVRNRLVGTLSLIVLSVAWFFQVLINAMAIYIRAHKVEPLMAASFFNGVYVLISTLFVSAFLPFDYLFFGFLSAYFFTLPWVFLLFEKYRGVS